MSAFLNVAAIVFFIMGVLFFISGLGAISYGINHRYPYAIECGFITVCASGVAFLIHFALKLA